MEDYHKLIKEVAAKSLFNPAQIFDYQDSPMKQEFDEAFEFYREALRLNEGYGITPNYIFLNTGYSVNALAGKNKDTYIISINMGTIKKLKEMFLDNSTILDNTDNEDFIRFEHSLNYPINKLLYENALHFTFYHELAHLIQNSEYLEEYLNEQPERVTKFSIDQHNLELDADEFSALCIGAHAIQYALSTFREKLTHDQLEKILIIVCSSALLYFLSFPTNREDIYLEKNSHPHPIIRITQIVFTIVGYSVQALRQMGINASINFKEITDKTIDFSSKITGKIFSENPLINYHSSIGKEGVKIAEYLRKCNNLRLANSSLAVMKWNKNARNLHS